MSSRALAISVEAVNKGEGTRQDTGGIDVEWMQRRPTFKLSPLDFLLLSIEIAYASLNLAHLPSLEKPNGNTQSVSEKVEGRRERDFEGTHQASHLVHLGHQSIDGRPKGQNVPLGSLKVRLGPEQPV